MFGRLLSLLSHLQGTARRHFFGLFVNLATLMILVLLFLAEALNEHIPWTRGSSPGKREGERKRDQAENPYVHGTEKSRTAGCQDTFDEYLHLMRSATEGSGDSKSSVKTRGRDTEPCCRQGRPTVVLNSAAAMHSFASPSAAAPCSRDLHTVGWSREYLGHEKDGPPWPTHQHFRDPSILVSQTSSWLVTSRPWTPCGLQSLVANISRTTPIRCSWSPVA